MSQVLHCHRQHRNQHDRYDNQREVVLDDLKIAEVITGEHAYSDPGDAADNVVGDKPPVSHAPDARDKRRERPDDRHEPRDDDRLAAVPFVEFVSSFQVLFVQKPDVLAMKDPGAHPVTYPVVDGVADDCRNREKHKQPEHIQRSQCGKRPGGKQQRVARQKGRNNQTSLAKNDQEQNQIGPGSVLSDDLVEMLVEVKKNVD